MLAKLASLNIPPSPAAGRCEFLRRAYLDTIGVLPEADETTHFLADAGPTSADRLIEALLARPEFVDYWAYKWSDLLWSMRDSCARRPFGPTTPGSATTSKPIPLGCISRGKSLRPKDDAQNGAANYYILHGDPLDMAETTSVAFLGMSINCARCHNHPLEKWTNSQYFAFANLFARVRTKSMPGEGNLIVFRTPRAS